MPHKQGLHILQAIHINLKQPKIMFLILDAWIQSADRILM